MIVTTELYGLDVGVLVLAGEPWALILWDEVRGRWVCQWRVHGWSVPA